jgi:hypothetical protein
MKKHHFHIPQKGEEHKGKRRKRTDFFITHTHTHIEERIEGEKGKRKCREEGKTLFDIANEGGKRKGGGTKARIRKREDE